MATNYNQIFDGGIIPLSADRAITVEVQQSPRGNVQLKIWTLYQTPEGEWGYSSANGGRGIIIPLSVDVATYLYEQLGKVVKLAEKLPQASGKTETKKVKTKATTKPQETVTLNGIDIPLTGELANIMLALAQATTTEKPRAKATKKSQSKK